MISMKQYRNILIAFVCSCLLILGSYSDLDAKVSKSKKSKSTTEKTSKSSSKSSSKKSKSEKKSKKSSKNDNDDEKSTKRSKRSKKNRDKDDDDKPTKKSKKSKKNKDKDDEEKPSKRTKKSKRNRVNDEDDDSRSTKKSRRNKKSRKNIKTSKLTESAKVEIAAIDTLAEGAFHKVYYIDQGSCHFTVHVLETDLTVPYNGISIMKAGNHLSELSKLQYISHDFDSTNTGVNILGAVNGNFWRAYSNYPIGPLVSNGEVIELNSYKAWTSGFFDNRNRLYIDRFKIEAKIKQKNCVSFTIDDVNRRSDPNSIILYNRYGGDTIPYISEKKMSKAVEEALNDDSYRDSTDLEFDTLALKKEIRLNQRFSTSEYSIPKLTLRYLTPPAINKRIPCLVVSIDTGAVAVPIRGCLISLGKDILQTKLPEIGDTVELKYTTNVQNNRIFLNAVSGTPRLIRNDKPKNEAQEEGSHGSRFINGKLPRTAIGTDKAQNTLYFVTVAPISRGRSSGASLADLSVIMKLIGSYNAMNLDGGGSTIMTINEENILNKTNPMASRRLSVGLGVTVKHKKKIPIEKLKELKDEKIEDEEGN